MTWTWKHCRLLPVLGAVAVGMIYLSTERLGVAAPGPSFDRGEERALLSTGEPQPLAPGATTILTHGSLAFLVHAPVDGSVPVVVAVFSFGGDVVPPPPPPPPSNVAGVIIVEELHERTVAMRLVMDDPVWQTAAIVKGLTYAIEDQDHPSVAHLARDELPAVFLIDSDGGVIDVRPLPATVEEMRALIGGLK